jgi:hypothetical protein
VGGTSGGLSEFLIGLGLASVGLYMLFQQVQVHTSFWRFGGQEIGFGPSLLPMLIGIGVLFANGKSKIGWVLTVCGLLFILAGILMNMDIYFRPTSLFNTILMLALIAGGMGLIFKSLRPHQKKDPA